MGNDFLSWIANELKSRGWSDSELARRMEVSPATVSRAMSGQTRITWDFCVSVAQAFSLLPEEVFRKAGLLSPLPSAVAEEQEAVHILRNMSAQQRAYILTTMRAIAGYEFTAQHPDFYREVLNVIWDMTPDELKERIIIRLQETAEEHEQEIAEREAQEETEELIEADDN